MSTLAWSTLPWHVVMPHVHEMDLSRCEPWQVGVVIMTIRRLVDIDAFFGHAH